MKKIILALLVFGLTDQALATSGIDCSEVVSKTSNSVKVFTEEASVAGDNLMRLGVDVAGKRLLMDKSSVSRQNKKMTVYMGSDSEGNSITLLKQSKSKVASVFIRLTDRTILQKQLICE